MSNILKGWSERILVGQYPFPHKDIHVLTSEPVNMLQKGLCDYIKVLEGGMILDYSSGSNIIRRMLTSKNWSISCHISKQGCHSHQWFQPSNVSWWALRGLGKMKNTCGLAAIRAAATPYSEPQWSSGCDQDRILAPDSWDTYKRNDFSEPRLLHLAIYRKALNSLTWDIWFSLTNNNLLLLRLPALCCKTSI